AREAAELAARRCERPRREDRPLLPVGGAADAHPLDRRRRDLHLLALARRLHHRPDRRGQGADARQRHLPRLRGGQPAAGRRPRDHPGRHHGDRAPGDPPHRGAGEPLMLVTPRARLVLRLFTALVLAFLYVPLIVIAVLSFSTSKAFICPPPGFSLLWRITALQENGRSARLRPSSRCPSCA